MPSKSYKFIIIEYSLTISCKKDAPPEKILSSIMKTEGKGVHWGTNKISGQKITIE